jgi:hypothetical protein
MSKVIDLIKHKNMAKIGNAYYSKPTDRESYLNLAKRVLPQELYKELLCAIMDEDLYNKSSKKIQAVADAYYHCYK